LYFRSTFFIASDLNYLCSAFDTVRIVQRYSQNPSRLWECGNFFRLRAV
jgi:hypothetical protein